jgi:hypothetical protein
MRGDGVQGPNSKAPPLSARIKQSSSNDAFRPNPTSRPFDATFKQAMNNAIVLLPLRTKTNHEGTVTNC